MSLVFKNYLLELTQSSDCKEFEVIQDLWSGYGTISRYQLKDSHLKTVIVKCISLEKDSKHPRGWDTDHSHQRKVKSYEVETNWYQKWNQKCTSDSRTPTFLGDLKEGKQQWIVLEDLDYEYPIRKQEVSLYEIKECLKWLAHFHATFMHTLPGGLWEIGTYWHLATRPDELEAIRNTKLKNKAHLIDKALNECEFKTIVHGDAKLANFCFSNPLENPEKLEVAAVDFQYVGGGCGMKDVAYFLGSCLSEEESERHEKELLDFLFQAPCQIYGN